MEIYHTIYKGGDGEIVEKKSRFIAEVHPVTSEEEAMEILEQTRKQYWDARHHCWAYIIGRNPAAERMSDDGEPAGTAGKPILEVIRGRELTNVLVIVTRYFGGILLGTGGLVRAYSDSMQNALELTEKVEKCTGIEFEAELEYNNLETFKYYCRKNNINIVNIQYENTIICKIQLEENTKSKLINDFETKNINLTNLRFLSKKIINKCKVK